MIRVTGGRFRGRILKTPKGSLTRPTQSKIREALFHSLESLCLSHPFPEAAESSALDLFSGSGALGIEALSRELCEKVVFVDPSRAAADVLRGNIAALEIKALATVIHAPVDRALGKIQGPFRWVFADPPYRKGWADRLLETLDWSAILEPQGVFSLEWNEGKRDALPERVGPLVKIKEKRYGDTRLTMYRRAG